MRLGARNGRREALPRAPNGLRPRWGKANPGGPKGEAAMAKKRIVFIDDDAEFEIPLFRKAFGSRFALVTGTDLDSVARKMEATGFKPDLFVLDLHFPQGPADPEAVARLRASALEVEDDKASLRAAYANMQKAQARLSEVMRAWRQGPEGGLKLARAVAARFPGTPIVFYSRKVSPLEAIACLTLKNVVGVERKITGASDRDTEQKTLAESARLASAFARAIAAEPAALEPLRQAARAVLGFLKAAFP